MSELQQVLDCLRSQGTLDSSGVFSIDLRKALPKLEKFQLPRPYFGLLKVIQSGVAAGAHQFNVRTTPAGITIEHDGDPPEKDELADLLTYLMAPDHPSEARSLRDLAIAVNTTLALGGSWVEVAVRDQEGGARNRWLNRQENRQLEDPGPLHSEMRVRFTLKRTAAQAVKGALGLAHKDVGALFRNSRDVMDEDQKVLYDRCRHCPVPIVLNGKPLPPSPFGVSVTRRWSLLTTRQHRKSNLIELYLTADEPSPHLLSPPGSSEVPLRFELPGVLRDGNLRIAPGARPQRADLAGVSRRCYAVLGLRGRLGVPARLTVVKDGVDLTDLCPETLPQGLAAILTAEGLGLDVSQFRLVQSPEVISRFELLKNLTTLLADLLLESPLAQELPGLDRQRLSNHLCSPSKLPT